MGVPSSPHGTGLPNGEFSGVALGDQEFFSSEYLTGEIAKLGFEVEFPYMGIPTAFRCELGDGDGPAVCFLAEYDALPGRSGDGFPLQGL